MATIDASYFSGGLTIAQKSDSAVGTTLTWFIDQGEEKVLSDLLGYELYKNYKTGIAAVSPDAKWADLRDGKEYTNRNEVLSKWKGLKFTSGTAKKSLIANFVYFNYMQDQFSITTGTGEKQATNQNAINATAGVKMVRAWNEMVGMNRELVEFLLSNQDTYTEFMDHYSRCIPNYLFYKINTLGI